MANAGAGVGPSDSDAIFYPADNQQMLIDSFDSIIQNVRSCKLSLKGEVDSDYDDQCKVKIDGQTVPHNTSDGWRLNNGNEIEFLGSSCESILTDASGVEVKCPCDAIVV